MNTQVEAGRTTWAGVFEGLSRRNLDDGEALIVPGERNGRLFFLEEGRLRCAVVSEGGSTKTVYYFWPGDLVGETSIFETPAPLPLLVTSVGPSAVKSLGQVEARRLALMNSSLAEELLASMARKTLGAIDQVRQLRFLSVEARVAAFLEKMHSRPGGDAGKELILTHEEIADYVGAHRVSVTEALKRMEATGAIETRRGRIAVKDLGLLQRAVGR